MTHMLSKAVVASALGIVALGATPASAQRRVPPVRPVVVDTGTAPLREAIVPPQRPQPAVPAAQRTPVLFEPVRPLARAQAPVQGARAMLFDSTAAAPVPVPLQRQPPVAAQSLAPSGAARSVAVAPTTVPAGSTGRCKDGTYINGTASDAACTDRGGLAVAFPAARVVPPARRP